MAPKAGDAPFSDQDGLNKFVADAKALIEAAPGESAKLAAVEKLVPQLQAGLDELQRRQAEAAVYVPTGTDADVTRAYTVPAANREEIRGGVVDLRKQMPGGISETARWAGSDGGVVRMIGGWEHGYWEYGLLDDPRPKSEWQAELQERVSKAAWVRAMQGETSQLFQSMRRGLVSFLRRGPPAVAKMLAANSGEGGEWISTLPLTMLERTAELPRILEGQIDDLPISAKTVTLPFLTSGVQPFLHGVTASGDLNPQKYPMSVPASSSRTITAPTLAVNIPVENDALEDSTIGDMIPLLQQLAGEALIDAREDQMVNGDTTTPHGDSGLASWNPDSRWSVLNHPGDHRKGIIGWRHRAIDESSTVDLTATQTVAQYIAERSSLTSPHGVLGTMYVTSPQHYLKKIVTDTNVLTVDKFGPAATIQTGQVANIGGSPLFLSQFMTADLNASGLYDGVTVTKTGLLIVARRRFRIARRRALRAAVERVERDGVTYIVASERAGMITIDGSGVKNVRYAYNLDK